MPSSLEESISKGDHDIAVRDYKKGKYIIQKTKAETQTKSLVINSKIFEKVWEAVETIAESFREQLFNNLTSQTLTNEELERTIT